jgi:hypothetical protein
MQCLDFDGLGDGLGSRDVDRPGLGDDPAGVLVPAVDVAPLGRGLAVRLSAGPGCLWATTRVRPGPAVCLWRAGSVAPRACGALLRATGVMTARTGGECGSVRIRPTPMMTAMTSAADPAAA